MITLAGFLFLGVGLFAINGIVRGWYRELLGTAGILSGMTSIWFLENKLHIFAKLNAQQVCIARSIILLIFMFIGYQVPTWREYRRGPRGLSSSLLGGFVAAVNGYLVIGSLWFFAATAKYSCYHLIYPPQDALSVKIANNLHYLPGMLVTNSMASVGVLLLVLLFVFGALI